MWTFTWFQFESVDDAPTAGHLDRVNELGLADAAVGQSGDHPDLGQTQPEAKSQNFSWRERDISILANYVYQVMMYSGLLVM